MLVSVTLENFRNYKKATLEFTPQTTLIVGPNASGKTSLLEALFAAATGKSFRADMDREMINWQAELGRVKVNLEENQLELVLTSGSILGNPAPLKKFLVNGLSRRLIDFVGNFRVVLFWPEDLELVIDGPSRRRRYLDSVLVQVDREYQRNLLSYERGLRQRNKLLDLINEGRAARQQLLFWNQLLIKTGCYLTDKRQEFIEFINNSYKDHKNYSNYQITYDKSIISESRLEEYAQEEVAAKATLVGPHRDEMVFCKSYNDYKNYKALSAYGSRGEQRLAILWLKLAELAFIEKMVGQRPVLLLDDILSELDKAHRELVLNLIEKQQTIVTSAEPEVISEDKRATMKLIRL